jgi:nuclear GTP-binding protein
MDKKNHEKHFIENSKKYKLRVKMIYSNSPMEKVVDASDIIIEVLDARDPLGCRCPQVEEAVLTSGKNKKLILLLNKIGMIFF